MSTVEISKEERDLWRFEATDECGTPSEKDERILRLLKTLEASEADLERSCEETRANFSELYRMANDVVPELKRGAEQAEARADKAEADVSRLNEMIDWLAEKLSDCQPVFTNCAVDCAECRKEAARRAVADSEVKA